MKTNDFYFDLPEALIAQTPVEPRDQSRLLSLKKGTFERTDHYFSDLIDLLRAGDLLVVNTSKVLPARLFGLKRGTGAVIELLLLREHRHMVWETLVKPGKKAKVGTVISFADGLLTGTIIEVQEDGNRLIEFQCDGHFYSILEQIGQMPLPPYITEVLKDQGRYQTVYADSGQVGSAAAPTAGLHFTPELLHRLQQKGVGLATVTLHVGLGTFRPVKADDITDHKMHAEHYYLPQQTVDLILKTKQHGGRVIGVGTTTCRTLETIATREGKLVESEGFTDIFIYPGYEFKVLDGLITNFHLPESTLIMLVSAFHGYEQTMQAYRYAVDHQYRFFSFGDAMLIL